MANALALASDNPLAALTNTEDNGVLPQDKLNYVGFYSKRSDAAIDIAQQVQGIAEGEPYVHTANGFKRVNSFGLTGSTFRYWCRLDTEYKIVEASLTDPGRGSDLKEHLMAPTIAYTPDGAYPCLTTFRPTKVKAALDLINGQRKAEDDACKAAGPVGKQLTALPVPMRIVGEADVIHKTSKAGFKYQLVRCTTRLLSDKECEMLAAVLNDPDFGETCARINDSYNARKDMVTKVASEA